MRSRSTSLWRNPDFLKLWAGQTISMFGSQVTALALPLLAAVTLEASPAQMAFLWAVGFTPAILVGLFAGVWVDRLRRRPILIGADLGRAALLLCVPAAYALGGLRIELLFAVAFLTGILNVCFDAADNAYLSSLVSREQLVEANSRLSASSSLAGIAGPGLAGGLIQLLTAPVAVAVDGVSFLVSAVSLGLIRKPEPTPTRSEGDRNVWGEIGEGLRALLGNHILRVLVLSSVTLDVFWNALFAVYFLYVTRELGLPPGAIGLIFGIGSAGGLAGSLLVGPAARRLGIGPSIVLAQLLVGLGGLLIAASVLLRPWALPLLVAAELIQSCANTVYGVNRGSLIQAVIPNRLLGRVHASISFIGLGVVPVGAGIGGLLGERVGVPETIVIGSCGGTLAFWWLVFSAVWKLGELPGPVEEVEARTAQ